MDFTNHSDSFSVVINSIRIGQIDYYHVKRAMVTEDTGNAQLTYTIKIHHRIGPDSNREIIDFYNSNSFLVDIKRIGITTRYAACILKSIEEEVGEDNQIYQTLTFVTTARTIL